MLFKSLHALAKSTQIFCTITSVEDDQLKVIVMPKQARDGENPALSTPLVLTGTPEELDEQFASVLSSYTTSRTSLAESLSASQTIMDAAKKEATDTAAKTVSAMTSQAPARAAVVPAETGEDEETSTTAKAATSDLDLFG